MLAFRQDYLDIVECLVSHGCDVSLIDHHVAFVLFIFDVSFRDARAFGTLVNMALSTPCNTSLVVSDMRKL